MREKVKTEMKGPERVLLKSIIVTIALVLLSFLSLKAKEKNPAWNIQFFKNPMIESTNLKTDIGIGKDNLSENLGSFHLRKRENKWLSLFKENGYSPENEHNHYETAPVYSKKLPEDVEPFHLKRRSKFEYKIKMDIFPRKRSVKPEQLISVADHNNSRNLGSILYNSSIVSVVVLNVADYILTTEALKHERLVESNPFVRAYSKNPALMATVKLGWTVANYHLMKKLYKKNKKLAWVVSAISNLALSYVVANNIRLINKVK